MINVATYRPGDILVIGTNEPIDDQTQNEFVDGVRKFLPDARVVMLHGVTHVSVLRPEGERT
jgi:hypothetical protein